MATGLTLYSAVHLVPVGNDDGDETIIGEMNGVSRDDVSAWALSLMGDPFGDGRVFVSAWRVDRFGERIDTGVTGEITAGETAVRWYECR